MKADQNAHILVHLQDKGPITPLEALSLYGCFRLGARIWDLKKRGHDIQTTMIRVGGKSVAQYSLNRPLAA